MQDKVIDQQLEQEAAVLEALNMRMSWVARKRMQQDLEAYGLTMAQYAAMRCMLESEEGCSMSELAESSYQVSATMTGIIDRLADRGLVERTRDPNDRRALRVMLTPAGRSLLNEVVATKRARTIQALSSLSKEERQAIIESAARYLEVMQNTLRSN